MSVDERDLAMSEDELARARFAERNSRSRLNDTMRQSFLSPKRAMNRIQKARAKHGDKTVFDKLRDPKSRAYGRRPGSLLSRGGLRGGARRKRHEALLARRRLPEQLLDHENSAGRLRGAERGHKEARDRYRPPAGGGPKQSFLSRLINRPSPDAVPAPHNQAGKGFSLKEALAKRAQRSAERPTSKPRPKGRDFERER